MYLLNDFSSINVWRGAFQTGPCRKQTSESNTHELSSAMFERFNYVYEKVVQYISNLFQTIL